MNSSKKCSPARTIFKNTYQARVSSREIKTKQIQMVPVNSRLLPEFGCGPSIGTFHCCAFS